MSSYKYFAIIIILSVAFCSRVFSQSLSVENEKISWLKKNAVNLNYPNLSDDNLSFLDDVLSNVDIVMLGESTHGDGKTFTAKTRLIKYLHEKLDFDVLIFESGLFECSLTWKALKSGVPFAEAFPMSVFPVWSKSAQVQELFRYISNNLGTEKELEFAGFDIQMTGNVSPSTRLKLLRQILLEIDSNYQEGSYSTFFKIYSSPRKYFRSKPDSSIVNKFNQEIIELEKFITNSDKVNNEQLVFARSLNNMRHFFKFAWNFKQGQGDFNIINIRDEEMGKNLIWLKENLYPDKKVILWGASSHLSWNRNLVEGYRGFIPMGQYVKDHYGESAFNIAFSSFTGLSGSINAKQLRDIEDKSKESIEFYLNKADYDYSFLNFRKQKNTRFLNKKFILRPFGHVNMKAKWPEMIDGLFFIREMTPSTIYKDK